MNKQLKKVLSMALVVIMLVASVSSAFAATTYPGHEGHKIIEIEAQPALGCVDGYTAGEFCDNCKVYVSGHEVITANHSPSGKWVTDPAVITDCTKGYDKYQKCDKAGCNEKLYLETISRHDLILDSSEKQFCHEEGKLEVKKCKVCNQTFTGASVAEKHSWGDDPDKGWIIEKDSSCEIAGSKYRECTICKYKETAAIEAPGHQWITKGGKLPTCVEKGYTSSKVCAKCSYEDPNSNLEISARGYHVDTNEDNRCEDCNMYFTEKAPLGCTCPCHSEGIMNILFKIVIFILQIFGVGEDCACGARHNII